MHAHLTPAPAPDYAPLHPRDWWIWRALRRLLWGVLGAYLLGGVLLWALQEQFIFQETNYDADATALQFDGLQAEPLQILASDSVPLQALYFRVPNTKGLVVYYHGNADDLRRWGQYAVDFTRLGYSVLMYDYRGYGASGGSLPTEAELLADAEAVYQFATRLLPPNQIVLLGRSLGSGLASYVAARHPARLLVLETPYRSLDALAHSYAPIYPVRWLLRYHLRTDTLLGGIPVPVTVIHGTADEVVPVAHALQLRQLRRAAERGRTDRLYLIPGGKHKNLRDFPRYHQALRETLD